MTLVRFDDFESGMFAADVQRRTVRGVLAPWDRIGRHADGRRWRFARGSLLFAHFKYLILNDEHTQTKVGRAIAAEDTETGLVVTFQMYETPAGDKALQSAVDGRQSGLSPEIMFDRADSGPDPQDPGVLLVHMAHLEGAALVRRPAFDDARLISVTASREGGSAMPEPVQPTTAPSAVPTPVEPTTAPVQDTAPAVTAPAGIMFSEAQFGAFLDRLGAANATATAVQDRPVVDPTRAGGAPAAPAQVTEPLPYRFSYQSGRTVFSSGAEHDFSTDLYAMLRNRETGRDYSAEATRVNGLIAAAFDVDRADTTDQTVPNRYRPDLWQPQMDYVTPLWDMINSGTTDGTKFEVPKFNSAAGLVGPATEGVEPAPGSFTATLQTITPTQVWGKVEITRQAWRAGGNPQLSGILWDQMLREYFEDREAAVATFLATLTAAADIVLPAGTGSNQAAVGRALEAAIASLQFVRGGNRFRAFAVHQDLYEDLAGAYDTTGRPLYPMLAPSNANGTSADLFRTLNIAGTTAVGAWALGAAGQTASVNSWLFDPAKVRGWASAPERLFWDFGATVQTANIPQLSHVTMGIYGDVAFANLDINGVRQVTYDPVA